MFKSCYFLIKKNMKWLRFVNFNSFKVFKQIFQINNIYLNYAFFLRKKKYYFS